MGYRAVLTGETTHTTLLPVCCLSGAPYRLFIPNQVAKPERALLELKGHSDNVAHLSWKSTHPDHLASTTGGDKTVRCGDRLEHCGVHLLSRTSAHELAYTAAHATALILSSCTAGHAHGQVLGLQDREADRYSVHPQRQHQPYMAPGRELPGGCQQGQHHQLCGRAEGQDQQELEEPNLRGAESVHMPCLCC